MKNQTSKEAFYRVPPRCPVFNCLAQGSRCQTLVKEYLQIIPIKKKKVLSHFLIRHMWTRHALSQMLYAYSPPDFCVSMYRKCSSVRCPTDKNPHGRIKCIICRSHLTKSESKVLKSNKYPRLLLFPTQNVDLCQYACIIVITDLRGHVCWHDCLSSSTQTKSPTLLSLTLQIMWEHV